MDTTFIYLILWAGLFAIIFAVFIKKGWILGGVKGGAKGRLDRNLVASKWQEIEELIMQKKPSAYKIAIIEADKLVDYVLKARVGVDGNMGDRLKEARSLFSNYSDYQNLWEAHKVRNRIAHEANHELHYAEVKKVVGYFKKALQYLKAL